MWMRRSNAGYRQSQRTSLYRKRDCPPRYSRNVKMAIKLGVSRCMHFKITDFRAFHETIPVRVAPLTIMVGENSAGKTSFLAALRYVYDIVTSPETASFNKPPFFLGAYDQVAHF